MLALGFWGAKGMVSGRGDGVSGVRGESGVCAMRRADVLIGMGEGTRWMRGRGILMIDSIVAIDNW